jgi:hypothetical protein
MTAPVPFAPQPSIVDRILGRLFPAGQYGGLLDPDTQRELQRRSLMNVGIGLLARGGQQPSQPGTLANLGSSLQQGQLDFPQMANQALQLQQYKSQIAEQQAIAKVGAAHPAQPNETPQQRYERQVAIANDLLTIPGGAAIAEKYAPILAATKPERPTPLREPMRIENVRDNLPGSPTHGLIGALLLDPETTKRVGFIPQVQKSEAPTKPTQQQIQPAEFGTAALAAWRQVEQERTQDPNVETEVGKILASPAFAKAVPGFHSSADLVQMLQKANASPGAVRYMRAKWSFLDNVIRTRTPAARLSGAMLQQIGQEFLPSLDPAANGQIRQNELQSLLTAQGESGYDQNPEVWNRAAKRHGVHTIDLQGLLSGGGLDQRETDIRTNPKY